MQGINSIVFDNTQVSTCPLLRGWCEAVTTAGSRVSLGYPWQFVLVQSLMGHLMVGRCGLQNPRGFGLLGFTWFAVSIKEKPLLYAGLPS